jgi:hypothetical protein
MPDSHRLPFYALAGTQNAITLMQFITLPNGSCLDDVISFPWPPFEFTQLPLRNYSMDKHSDLPSKLSR